MVNLIMWFINLFKNRKIIPLGAAEEHEPICTCNFIELCDAGTDISCSGLVFTANPCQIHGGDNPTKDNDNNQ